MTTAIITVWLLIGHADGLHSSLKSVQYGDIQSCELVRSAALKSSGLGASLRCVKASIVKGASK